MIVGLANGFIRAGIILAGMGLTADLSFERIPILESSRKRGI
jgi:hypothetical protein